MRAPHDLAGVRMTPAPLAAVVVGACMVGFVAGYVIMLAALAL